MEQKSKGHILNFQKSPNLHHPNVHVQKEIAYRTVAAAIPMQRIAQAGMDSHDTVQPISIGCTAGSTTNIIQYSTQQYST